MIVGERVYWHGHSPDLNRQGSVVKLGIVRSLVLWDGEEEPVLVTNLYLAAVPS